MVYALPSLAQFTLYLLFFSRVVGMFISAPIFGTRTIPSRVKIGFALILSYLFYELLIPGTKLGLEQFNVLTVFALIAMELLVGLLIGFIALLVFGVIQFAGNMIDVLTGMHVASVMDPMTREQQSLIGQLQYIIVILLFLAFNGHHYIIHAVYNSYAIIPLGSFTLESFSPVAFLTVFNKSFLVGLQLSAPIIAILFLIDFSLGIIAKGVPQMNVFLTGMPLKIMVGFMAMFLCFVYFGSFFSKIPLMTYQNIIYVLKSF